MIVIGIDPGKYGAISVLHDKSFLAVEDAPLMKHPTNGKDVLDDEAMKRFLDHAARCKKSQPVRAFLELQHVFPQQGAVSGFSIGDGFGLWRGVLRGSGIPYEVLPSSVWRKRIFTAEEIAMMNERPPGKLTAKMKAIIKERRKIMSIEKAKRFFPAAKPYLEYGKRQRMTDGRAEAILIALAGMREVW